jgi:hypothetical protein
LFEGYFPMHPVFVARSAAPAVPITFVTAANWPQHRSQLDAHARAFAEASGFEPKAGRHLLMPAPDGGLAGVLFALEPDDDPLKDTFRPGALATLLPAGTYRFANAPHDARLAALAIALGSYRFTRYRKAEGKDVKLELPDGVDGDDVSRIVEGVWLARDLINTPANDMGPAELEYAARALAIEHGAGVNVIVGDDLLTENFPLIHAVGRAAAADRPPRLIDITWGDASHPKVTLIGKGVCFDTGGLDIKSDAGMLNMKKDMGGAATMLALAHMLMSRGIKLRCACSFRRSRIRSRARRSARAISIVAQGHHGRDRQHRRRRPLILADAMALARGEARADRRHGDADRRRARRARHRGGAVLYRRRSARLRAHGLREDRERSALAAAALALLRPAARFQGRRHQQHWAGRLRRIDHRRAVPAPFHHRGEGLAALRHLRVEPGGAAGTPGGRRVPSGAARSMRCW